MTTKTTGRELSTTTAGALTPPPPVLDGLIGAWLAEVEARRGSDRTPAEYARILARFLSLPGIDGDPSRATTAHATAFKLAGGPAGNYRSKVKPGASTMLVRLAAVRSFFDFARRNGAPWADPTVDVPRPEKKAAAPRGLTADDAKALLAALPDSPAGKRDGALIRLSMTLGLRRRELVSIKAGDLTRNGKVYLTWRAKGGKVRRRALDARVYRAIVVAVEARGERIEDLPAEALLLPVSGGTFAQNLRRYGIEAGIVGLTVHQLRHTAAQLRRAVGEEIEEVSAMLGHEDLATTARYLKQLEGEDDPGGAKVAALLGL